MTNTDGGPDPRITEGYMAAIGYRSRTGAMTLVPDKPAQYAIADFMDLIDQSGEPIPDETRRRLADSRVEWNMRDGLMASGIASFYMASIRGALAALCETYRDQERHNGAKWTREEWAARAKARESACLALYENEQIDAQAENRRRMFEAKAADRAREPYNPFIEAFGPDVVALLMVEDSEPTPPASYPADFIGLVYAYGQAMFEAGKAISARRNGQWDSDEDHEAYHVAYDSARRTWGFIERRVMNALANAGQAAFVALDTPEPDEID